MNYWKTLNELGIEEYLNSYKTDFTEHDKKDLEGYTGDFILAIRKTGTNLIKLETNEDPKRDKQDMVDNAETWILGYNKRFFHGYNGKVMEIERDTVMKVVETYNDGFSYN